MTLYIHKSNNSSGIENLSFMKFADEARLHMQEAQRAKIKS